MEVIAAMEAAALAFGFVASTRNRNQDMSDLFRQIVTAYVKYITYGMICCKIAIDFFRKCLAAGVTYGRRAPLSENKQMFRVI